MSYTYTSNIPQSNQTISSTQAPICSNFQAINEALSANHVSFLDSINFGKHTYTSLQMQNSDPDTSLTQMAIYCKALASSTNGMELFYRYPNNGAVVQLTGSVGGTSANAATNGWSYLTSTLLMKWGTTTGIINGTNVITFPTAGGIPAFTSNVYSLQFNPSTNITSAVNPYPFLSATTTTTFTLTTFSTQITSVYWLAIGV